LNTIIDGTRGLGFTSSSEFRDSTCTVADETELDEDAEQLATDDVESGVSSDDDVDSRVSSEEEFGVRTCDGGQTISVLGVCLIVD